MVPNLEGRIQSQLFACVLGCLSSFLRSDTSRQKEVVVSLVAVCLFFVFRHLLVLGLFGSRGSATSRHETQVMRVSYLFLCERTKFLTHGVLGTVCIELVSPESDYGSAQC